MLTAAIVGEEHCDVTAMQVRFLSSAMALQDIIAILGMDELSEEDRGSFRAGTEEWNNPRSPSTSPRCSPARLGAADRGHVKGFKGIVEGKYDNLPEAAFYMVGAIEQAVEKAKKLAAEAARARVAPGSQPSARASISTICRRTRCCSTAPLSPCSCRAPKGTSWCSTITRR